MPYQKLKKNNITNKLELWIIIKIILKKVWFCDKAELYSIRILPVSVLCQVNLCSNVFKINSNILKNNIQILTGSQIHNHNTRYRENFVIPESETKFGTMTFYTRALSLFNSIDQTIKNIFSFNIFKTRIKEHFYEKYCVANRINIR